MKKFLVIGYFGYITNQIDGQTIKTRSIYALLCKMEKYVEYFDTQSLQQHKLNILLLLKLLLTNEVIIYLPGKKNLKYLSPLVFALSKICNYKIIYPVVGGWLSQYLRGRKMLINHLSKVEIILVESKSLKKSLETNYHFKNVAWFPNFRLHSFKSLANNHKGIRLVFMARIMKEKGVNLIFEFLSKHLCTKSPVSVSFYGPIKEEYREEFENQLQNCPIAKYFGVVEPDNVYSVLSQHDILLLPTFYEGEGFPGSIIDAYISGIPVIASKWKDIPEFIEDGRSGYTFDIQHKEDFYNLINRLIDDRQLLNSMKDFSKKKSEEYSADIAWHILSKYI